MSASLHFMKETPTESMFSDFQAVSKFNNKCNGNARIHKELSFHHIPSEKKYALRKQWIIPIRRDEGPFFKQFAQLVEYVFLFLTEPGKTSRLLSQLDDFAQQNDVSACALKNVFKSLLSFPSSALKKSLSPSQIKEDLMNLGLTEEKCEHFTEQWKQNLVALSQGALSKTLMVNQLVDMEWKFGVTASSSELDKVGNTFLQLKLVINTGNGTKNTYMELSLPQFYSFLHEMEKAKASLEYLC